MRHVRPALAVAALTIAALAFAGCGGNAPTSGDAAPTPTVASPAVGGDPTPTSTGAADATGSSIVPPVDVIDVSTGRSVALRTTIATDKPTLIWMWAPH